MALYYLNQYISKVLETTGGIDISQTTDIELPDVTGLEISKPGIAIISYSDPLDTDNAEWITYTSINNTTKKFEGVTRGQEGFAAKAHDKGVVIAFPISESHINNVNDMLTGVTAPTLLSPIISGTAKVTAEGLNVNSMHRQAIMNGNFDIWQRGTSFAGSVYGADRFVSSTAGGSETLSQQTHTLGQTDVPYNPKYYMRNVVVTGGGATDKHNIQQRIEGVQNFAGAEVTFSFWAKADSSKNISIEFNQYFGTGGSPSSIVTGIGVSKETLSAVWQKITVTATMPSISGKTLGTDGNDWLGAIIWCEAGSSFDARTDTLGNQSGTFEFDEFQLNLGDTALPFQPKTVAVELADCQRYYEKSFLYSEAPVNSSTQQTIFSGVAYSTTNIRCWVPYLVQKRTAAPTVTLYSSVTADDGKWSYYDGSWQNPTSSNTTSGSTSRGVFVTIVSSGLTANEAHLVNGNLTAESEL